MTERDITSYPEEAQAYIRELREEAKQNRLKASDLETKVSERDSIVAQANSRLDELNAKVAASQEITTKYSALQDEHAQFLAASSQKEDQLNRLNAALEAGLPHTYAGRLQGDTPDALKADAEAFKQSLGTSFGFATGDRTNGSGAAGPQDENTLLTQAIARHFANEGE